MAQANGQPRFESDVKGLFRERDVGAMRFAFDLSKYEDVKANAPGILERLESGSMPCDGAWPPERVAVFRHWVESGMAE
jgi:hypothetical protein